MPTGIWHLCGVYPNTVQLNNAESTLDVLIRALVGLSFQEFSEQFRIDFITSCVNEFFRPCEFYGGSSNYICWSVEHFDYQGQVLGIT